MKEKEIKKNEEIKKEKQQLYSTKEKKPLAPGACAPRGGIKKTESHKLCVVIGKIAQIVVSQFSHWKDSPDSG